MLKKIVKYLAALLPKVKKLIPTLHSSVVELDSDPVIRAKKVKIKTYLINYVEKHGASDLILCISAFFSSIAALLLILLFVSAFVVI